MLERFKQMLGFAPKSAPERADQTAVDISVSRRRNEEAARRLMETVKQDHSPSEEMSGVLKQLLGPHK